MCITKTERCVRRGGACRHIVDHVKAAAAYFKLHSHLRCSHPATFLTGNQLQCILGDARLLHNLPAGFHSSPTDRHTRPHGGRQVALKGLCVLEEMERQRQLQQTKSWSATLSSRHVDYFFQEPLVYLSIPLSLSFLPLFRCRIFPAQNSISKLVPARQALNSSLGPRKHTHTHSIRAPQAPYNPQTLGAQVHTCTRPQQ